MTKIAIVQIYTPPYYDKRAAGLMYAAMNFRKSLGLNGIHSELFYATERGKYDKAAHPDWEFISVGPIGIDRLNSFDAVVFNAAGDYKEKRSAVENPWYRPLLDNLKKPMALWICGENDADLRNYHLFTEHPHLRVVVEAAEGVARHAFPDLVPEIPTFPYNSFAPVEPGLEGLHPVKALDYVGDAKVDTIISTSRLTTRKRVYELVQQVGNLQGVGIRLVVAGGNPNYFYAKAIKDLSGPGWDYWEGGYAHDQLPRLLGPARWHWGGTWVRAKMFPRLELVTTEAVAFGCVPVLEPSTIPSWVKPDMAVLVDKDNLDGLAGKLREERDDAETLRKFMEGFREYEDPVKKARRVAELLV